MDECTAYSGKYRRGGSLLSGMLPTLIKFVEREGVDGDKVTETVELRLETRVIFGYQVAYTFLNRLFR